MVAALGIKAFSGCVMGSAARPAQDPAAFVLEGAYPGQRRRGPGEPPMPQAAYRGHGAAQTTSTPGNDPRERAQKAPPRNRRVEGILRLLGMPDQGDGLARRSPTASSGDSRVQNHDVARPPSSLGLVGPRARCDGPRRILQAFDSTATAKDSRECPASRRTATARSGPERRPARPGRPAQVSVG